MKKVHSDNFLPVDILRNLFQIHVRNFVSDEEKKDRVSGIKLSEDEEEITSQKIDIDSELKKLSNESHFSLRITKESEDVENKINSKMQYFAV